MRSRLRWTATSQESCVQPCKGSGVYTPLPPLLVFGRRRTSHGTSRTPNTRHSYRHPLRPPLQLQLQPAVPDKLQGAMPHPHPHVVSRWPIARHRRRTNAPLSPRAGPPPARPSKDDNLAAPRRRLDIPTVLDGPLARGDATASEPSLVPTCSPPPAWRLAAMSSITSPHGACPLSILRASLWASGACPIASRHACHRPTSAPTSAPPSAT